MKDLSLILGRLKEKLNLKNDSELASYLGMASGTISNWKNRNKIPYEEIFSICEKSSIDIGYIFYGTVRSVNCNLPSHILDLTEKSFELNPDGLQNTLVEFVFENSIKEKLRTYDKSIPFIKYLFWDRYDTVASYRFMQQLLKKIQKTTDLKYLQVENSKQILQEALEEYSLGIIEFFKNSLQKKDKPITSKLIIETLDDWDAYCILKDIDLAINAFEDSINWLSFILPFSKLKKEA